MKYIYTLLAILYVSPLVVHGAGETTTGGSLARFLGKIKDILSDIVIPLLITLALAVFFWGIVVSIYKAGSDSKAVTQGRTLLLWGIVALFVMISIWGLVNLVADTFEISSNNSRTIPKLGTY
ncbi:MAG: hypothetical protein RI996_347 [Candidatus Parcubacteria bacterium]|jgi:hypothetical protein